MREIGASDTGHFAHILPGLALAVTEEARQLGLGIGTRNVEIGREILPTLQRIVVTSRARGSDQITSPRIPRTKINRGACPILGDLPFGVEQHAVIHVLPLRLVELESRADFASRTQGPEIGE